MRTHSRLEALSTGHFPWVAGALIVIPASSIAAALLWHSIDDVNKFVDSVVKVVVALLGAAWALNRLFTTRADAPQLRVDGSAVHVKGSHFGDSQSDDLVLCHVEATNTGTTLLQEYTWQLAVHVVRPGHTDRQLAAVPTHPMPPIEPGSWAAIDLPTASPADVAVVRLVLAVFDASGDLTWTWRRAFTLVVVAS